MVSVFVREEIGQWYLQLASTVSAQANRMSTSADSAVANSIARYTPFGDWRTEPTAGLTDRGYTSHLHNNLGSGSDDLGLIYMNARYYSPSIARFISADTIVPNPTSPQSFNRYSYAQNNPINRIDPSGHVDCALLPEDDCPGYSRHNSSRFRRDSDVGYYTRTDRSSSVPGECSDHLCNDWAGRAILSHWLFGSGEDVVIDHDPAWTEYMTANPILRGSLLGRSIGDAIHMYDTGSPSMSIDESFQGWLENGEGIVGYQYLHGTEKTVGGFQRVGQATMTTDAEGNYIVTFNLTYTWNDIMDPNFKYETDTWKSKLGETLTQGGATDYTLKIIWSETIIIKLNSEGVLTSLMYQ